jgi:hypothetical protein
MGIDAQQKPPGPVVPAIQFGSVRQIRVSPQGHRSRHGLDQLHGPLNPLHATAVADCVARSGDQIEYFLGVGQTDDQRPLRRL